MCTPTSGRLPVIVAVIAVLALAAPAAAQRLLNRLIELNKQFSFMAYPNRRHGISGLHIDTLRWEFITQHLQAGGR